ncbi:SA1320 family protein [Rossellomorea marisflavi]|uniref:SA1320 family protein n=1 Tax=Rossellomorea marisflavi TaxID=189381 RepID=UPI00064ED69C|nr:hypothetical protein [Rossellomorea marisflavi]KML02909.1 hypothetical protein VL06_14630 [Rossellomorea marisflavi]
MKKIDSHYKSNPNPLDSTSDPDLVELAGKHVYQDYKIGVKFEVNNKEFVVLDTRYNHSTGLDAMTVENVKTHEVSIIYQGTQLKKKYGRKDLETDILLTTDSPTIAQLDASQEYYIEMEAKFGVSSVAGNSLAGPLAFSALQVDPELRCVTENPAPAPKGFLDPNQEYSNTLNFYSKYDPLTLSTKALSIDRAPGKVVEMEAGAPIATKERMGANHTGFKTESFKVRGMTINTAADDHIVTSLWTGETLTGESSTRIDVNIESIDLLYKGLLKVSKDFELAKSYMMKSQEVVLKEESIFTMRLETMISTFNDMIEESITEPSLKGITRAQSAIFNEVNDWISKLDLAEHHFQSLNAILNSPPVELLEHIIKVDISVESLFQEAREALNTFFLETYSLSEGFSQINQNIMPLLLSEAQNKVDDFLVNDMRDHLSIINSNSTKVEQQLTDFSDKVEFFKEQLEERDITSAISIKLQANAISDIVKMPSKNDFSLEESNHLLLGMKLKELILDTSFNFFNTLTHKLIGIPIAALSGIVGILEGALKSISVSIRKVLDFSHAVTLPASLFPQFQEMEQKIRSLAESITSPLDYLSSLLSGVRDSLFRLSIFLPNLVQAFKPYLDDAIFNKLNYDDINILNLSAMTQLKELRLLFNDISFQLGEHKAKSIEALGETSNLVIQNLEKLTDQIRKVTFE